MSESSEQAKRLSQWRVAFDGAAARRQLGSLFVLADEAPTAPIRVEAQRLTARLLLAHHSQHPAPTQLDAMLARLGSITRKAAHTPPLIASEQPPLPSYEQAFLFSGHMIGKPDRRTPRFPADKESIARRAIEEALSRAQAGSSDVAICGAACGGDTLFAEVCLARGVALELFLALDEPDFLAASVAFAGTQWVERYRKLVAHPRTTRHIMPRELGPTPNKADVYERSNRWQLATAATAGRLHLIALWDGNPGDGRGGTAHMIEEARAFGGETTILKTSALWPTTAARHV
ncbi:MAG: hypothetical protein U0172_12830 [Nitrospiraceae bacterium]